MTTGSEFSLLETPDAVWRLHGPVDQSRISGAAELLENLVTTARDAKERAYAPYSGFRVGSAVKMDGESFSGANIENASYGGTLCAERVALAAAVIAGHRHLEWLAVSTSAEPGSPPAQRSPCGICRQAASEFASDETLVVLDSGNTGDGRLLGEVVGFDWLLPWRFALER